MKTNHLEMMRVVLEASEHLPTAQRIRVLRGLAEICGDRQEQDELHHLALSLEQADKNCREFNFSFVQKYKVQ